MVVPNELLAKNEDLKELGLKWVEDENGEIVLIALENF
jgi:hypothetical protein